jgi:Carboxypeptidase regulatory-like domain
MSRRILPFVLLLGAAAAVLRAQTPQTGSQRPGGPTSQQPARDTPAQQNAAPSPGGRLSGRVVAADNGRPVKRARVFIAAAELPGGRGMLTDDDGAFDFADLPPGRYTLTASKSGFIGLSYGQRRPLQAGTPLQLLDGQQLKGVDFALPRGGVISGRVSDETGDVMPGVGVSVMRYQYLQGDRRLVPAGQGQTDDRGAYRIWGLNPGEYYISAVARGEGLGGRGAALATAGGRGGAAVFAGRGRGPTQSGSGAPATGDDQNQLMYAPTYYPGVGSVGEARAVTLGVSQELTGIDFNLQLVRTARISGHVENPDGSWAGMGNVNLMPQGNTRAGGPAGNAYGGRIGWDGQFTISDVPPGLYTLRARNNDRDAPLTASQPLAVNAGDVDNVVVILQTGGSLSGTIVFQPGTTSPPADLTQVRISAPSADADDNMGPVANPRVNKDGSFTMDGVTVGSHFIRPNGGGNLRGWTLKSVTIDGRDVTDTPIGIRSGQKIGNVVVTFSDKVNEISGTVADDQNVPVTEFTVLAFSTDSSVWRAQSRHIMTARPDQTGTFKIRGLPAGEYYLVTVDPAEQGEWFEPAYLNQHRQDATRLTLSDGDVKTQNFRVRR